MNPALDNFLAKADAVMHSAPPAAPPSDVRKRDVGQHRPSRRLYVGVDLGTAYTVLVVLDENRQPLAGEYRFAQIVRDGLVVDYHGAIELLRELKQNIEHRIGSELTSAATTFPPGVLPAEVRATRHIVQAAGMECSQAVDEPTAANAVLQVRNGAVVDVGGGTTGIAVFKDGEVVYTADEPTGGTHFSLVIAGGLGIEFEEAEKIKKDPKRYQRLFPLVKPVMEKVGTIVARHVKGHAVEKIYLVGGTVCFPHLDRVVADVTGIETSIPGFPLFVTPLGTALHNTPEKGTE